jgi:hypothetical protein
LRFMPLTPFRSYRVCCEQRDVVITTCDAIVLQRDLIFPVCSVCNSLCSAHTHFLHFSFRRRVNGQRFALLSVCGHCTCERCCATLNWSLSAKTAKLHNFFAIACGNFKGQKVGLNRESITPNAS